MTATPYGNGLYQTGIVISGLASLGSGAVALSQQIANPVLGGSNSYPTAADLIITLGTTLTAGAGTPNIQAVLLRSLTASGATEVSGVSSNQLFPFYGSAQENLIPSQAYTSASIIAIKGLSWPSSPYLYLALLDNTGAAFPSLVTGTLYPYGGSFG